MFSFSLHLIWFIIYLLLFNDTWIHCINDKGSRDDGFFETLKMLNLEEKYPQLSKSGTCFFISNISVNMIQTNLFTIILSVGIKESIKQKLHFCTNINNGSQLENITENSISRKDSILAVSQTIGIVICGLLLSIFFFIAGFMRIKNFLRRNKSTLKINGLRSCLTNEDNTNKWITSATSNNTSQTTVSNYLQLQSVMDRSVNQFMIKPTHYSKSIEQENKKVNSSIRRKTSIKNKLIPKKTVNQNSQRRYSLSYEIDAVMNKHFNMIGVARKSGYRSTQNIGGFLQRSGLSQNNMSQNSIINDQQYRNRTLNSISDTIEFNNLQRNKSYRNSNFPCRRATTIGGRSNTTRVKNSPRTDGMYSSQHSVVNTQSRNLIRKQLTLDEGQESFERYLLNSHSETDNKKENNSEPCYLKVPPKPTDLSMTNKCNFNISDEKNSPSPESLGTNSRCSSFEKASSNWSSLDVQESEIVEKKLMNI